MHKALVVGGVESVVKKSVTPFLAEYGIEVTHVWGIDSGKTLLRPDLPAGVDTCLLLVDMAPRDTMLPALKAMCSKRRVVLVCSPRKQAQMDRALTLAGFYRMKPKVAPVEMSLEEAEDEEVPLAPVREPVPAPEPVIEPPKEESMSKPLVAAVPAPSAPSFNDSVAQLKTVLKVLRDTHGVDEVLYSRSSGLEITRRQTINDSVD